MQQNTPISGIMTRKPEFAAPADTLDRIREIFETHGFHHIPVVENGKLAGIVSYNDYVDSIRNLFSNITDPEQINKGLNTTLVKDIMTSEVHSLLQTDTLGKAVQIFHTYQFHALPVVDEQQNLVGILTTNDLMKVLEVLIAPEKSYTD
ncbi:MAG: CBS domain-containing protein [Saprospiraceae bacterium]|nr:CBS domain-containing protein [Saprospiraceae bacterium]